MIVSIGIDMVEVLRIEKAVERTPRFAERVFTDAERTYCDAKGRGSAGSYAARFAAKEAFFKALKTGWRGKLAWQDLDIVVDKLGAPSLNVSGEAARLLADCGADRVHLTLSHTAEYAIAEVILENTTS